MNVLDHEERRDDEYGYSITRVGGSEDGREFRMVKARMEDGSVRWLWASNMHNGYFKQAFVPFDFAHPQVIDA